MKIKVYGAIPEVGKFYHFWDDGKSSPSRHYICKVERVITPEEAKDIMVAVTDWDFDENGEVKRVTSLYDHWKEEAVPNHDWLYANDTDCFVEASCPRYDENNLWFARTKDGGWFSMDIQSSWQGGTLDIDGSVYDYNTKYYQKYSGCSDKELLGVYPEANEENWNKK